MLPICGFIRGVTVMSNGAVSAIVKGVMDGRGGGRGDGVRREVME